MKNRNIIIILIILLVIIIIGLIAFLGICLNGKGSFMFNFGNFGRKSTDKIFEESYNIQEINNVEILSNAADIKIENGIDENIRVVVYGEDTSDVKVDFYNNKLAIDNSRHSKKWSFFSSYINEIVVYIPRNYSNEINIKNNYGNCQADDLENATINIDADCGNIELQKIKDVNVNCSFGNVSIRTVLNKIKVNSDCGNVKIEELQIKENSSIKSDYGNVKINHTNDIYIEANVDLGDVKVKNNNRSAEITLKIDADCGDVKVGE